MASVSISTAPQRFTCVRLPGPHLTESCPPFPGPFTTWHLIPKPRDLCLAEGTHAGWLHEVLAPQVQEIVVSGVRQSRGAKDDKRDAFGLAEELGIGAIKTRVHKGLGSLDSSES